MNTRVVTLCAALALMAVPAWADWLPGDPYKMHYPQLPDPQGWDVSFTNATLGDDWLCTETGVVNGIHLWVSFRHDLVPSEQGIVWGTVQILSDVPAGVDASYSHPGELLWGAWVDTRWPNVKMRPWPEPTPTEQGWLDPTIPTIEPGDHVNTYQINIEPAGLQGTELFVQTEGQVYWLLAKLFVTDPASPTLPEIGWKTSGSPQFRDDAVFSTPIGPGWLPLEDPTSPIFRSLDLAFVITPIPEPATLALMVLAVVGAAALSRRPIV